MTSFCTKSWDALRPKAGRKIAGMAFEQKCSIHLYQHKMDNNVFNPNFVVSIRLPKARGTYLNSKPWIAPPWQIATCSPKNSPNFKMVTMARAHHKASLRQNKTPYCFCFSIFMFQEKPMVTSLCNHKTRSPWIGKNLLALKQKVGDITHFWLMRKCGSIQKLAQLDRFGNKPTTSRS